MGDYITINYNIMKVALDRNKSAYHIDSTHASHPVAQGSNAAFPINVFMLLRLIDGTAQNSGQRLDNVN